MLEVKEKGQDKRKGTFHLNPPNFKITAGIKINELDQICHATVQSKTNITFLVDKPIIIMSGRNLFFTHMRREQEFQ